MQTVALVIRLSTQDHHDDGIEVRQSDLCLPPQAERQASVKRGQVVNVCFPVMMPGEDGRVIPFGRYDLTAAHQGGSSGTSTEELVLVNLHNGARLVLSLQELTTVARDPDVEII